ncbi:MAG: rhomboid family intramembrane serine protease, partial [Gemmatimonadota bacterium]|nr:rhomboid family intramembrane serine protease [Gemmatimonadota bacterium]
LLFYLPVLTLQRPWTPVTYMFLHGGTMHLLFNMIVLFFFGPQLEQRLGGRHFLGLYFVSGLVAALFSALTPLSPVVGASGAIYGVMLAYARFWPRDRIYIWAILPVEARWMVLGLTALALVGMAGAIGGSSDGIAHHAHLGGFAGAWLYLRFLGQYSAAAKFQRKADPAPKKGWAHDRDALQRWTRIDRDSLHEVNREAYDAIMAKLATHGIAGLTDRERSFLDRFSGTA